MDTAFIRFGHGCEHGDRGRCEAFDGFEIIAAPLGEFDQASRDSRVFHRPSGNAVTYASHAIKLARLAGTSSGLYILMHHGGGREVLSLPDFYDGGDLEQALHGMPERLQYALLYMIWKTARNAREEAQSETARRWAQAYADKRIRQRRATKSRGARVEIIPDWEAKSMRRARTGRATS